MAEHPTQFVMQRLFAACELDWKVLTVEVELEDFEDAIRGMQAMKFSAVRLYGEFEAQVLGVLPIEDPLIQPVGAVTSLLHADGKWQAWHSLGRGLVQAANVLLDWPAACCLVTEDTPQTRGFLWAMNSETQSFQSVLSDDPSADCGAMIESLDVPSESLSDLSDEELEHRISEGHFLVLGTLSSDTEDRLVTAAEKTTGAGMVVAQGAEPSSGSSKLAKLPGVHILSRLDQLAYAEAYDFSRWTGVPVDVAQVRDACEEFFEF